MAYGRIYKLIELRQMKTKSSQKEMKATHEKVSRHQSFVFSLSILNAAKWCWISNIHIAQRTTYVSFAVSLWGNVTLWSPLPRPLTEAFLCRYFLTFFSVRVCEVLVRLNEKCWPNFISWTPFITNSIVISASDGSIRSTHTNPQAHLMIFGCRGRSQAS